MVVLEHGIISSPYFVNVLNMALWVNFMGQPHAQSFISQERSQRVSFVVVGMLNLLLVPCLILSRASY